MTDSCYDKPMALPPFKSYRYRLAHGGYVMIGAHDRLDALNEAARSLEGGRAVMDLLEEWDGTRYVAATANEGT